MTPDEPAWMRRIQMEVDQQKQPLWQDLSWKFACQHAPACESEEVHLRRIAWSTQQRIQIQREAADNFSAATVNTQQVSIPAGAAHELQMHAARQAETYGPFGVNIILPKKTTRIETPPPCPRPIISRDDLRWVAARMADISSLAALWWLAVKVLG